MPREGCLLAHLARASSRLSTQRRQPRPPGSPRFVRWGWSESVRPHARMPVTVQYHSWSLSNRFFFDPSTSSHPSTSLARPSYWIVAHTLARLLHASLPFILLLLFHPKAVVVGLRPTITLYKVLYSPQDHSLNGRPRPYIQNLTCLAGPRRGQSQFGIYLLSASF